MSWPRDELVAAKRTKAVVCALKFGPVGCLVNWFVVCCLGISGRRRRNAIAAFTEELTTEMRTETSVCFGQENFLQLNIESDHVGGKMNIHNFGAWVTESPNTVTARRSNAI